MKRLVVISSSLRNNSNSEMLAHNFEKGALEAGNQVEYITLKDKKIGYCIGCLTCQNTHKCVIQDDAISIAEKLKTADVICFATPVYYYGMSGQLKTLLDRCNSLYSSDYKFKDIYLIATAAENEKETVAGTIKGIQGWIDCYERANLKGLVFGGGVDNPGEINESHKCMEAFNMGKNI